MKDDLYLLDGGLTEARVNTWIKRALPLAGALALFAITGCQSASLVAVPPVGPDSIASNKSDSEGILQVYSARLPAITDVNFEEFFANDDVAGNPFPLAPAHSDYTIYTETGSVFERVHNARNLADAQPALVTLPTGTYKIEAQAKGVDPGTFPAVVPITIQAGRTTHVHLDGEEHLTAGNSGR
jgi:hypothetical protein